MNNNNYRITPPKFELPSGLASPESKTLKLDNNIDVHYFPGGTQEVVKIDFVFSAGVVQANKPLVATVTNTLLSEGTQTKSAFEIAEKVDFYGAYLEQSTNYHHARLTLYALTKYLPNLLPIIEEIIKTPALSQSEFDVLMAKKRQDYLVDSEKVKVLAHRKALEVVFGNEHQYGKVATLNSFDNLLLNDIHEFKRKQYASNLCTIIVAGRPGNNFNELLNSHFGGSDWANSTLDTHNISQPKPNAERTHIITKEGALQSAIRITRQGVTKGHADYQPLLVLNTLLGGYFGSRLMTSLREEKGLTYGISSYVIPFLKAGTINVSTEVIGEQRDLAIREIFAEMDKLRNVLVQDDELTRVKNFMLGDLMRNLDGPFAVADAFRSLLGYDNLDVDYYFNLEKVIKQISAQQLQDLANKYLNKDDFYVVVAGK